MKKKSFFIFLTKKCAVNELLNSGKERNIKENCIHKENLEKRDCETLQII